MKLSLTSLSIVAACGILNLPSAEAATPVDSMAYPQTMSSAPIYLYKNKDGIVYTLHLQYVERLEGGPEYRLSKKYLFPEHFRALQEMGASIAYLPDIELGPEDALQTKAGGNQCNATSFPRDFNIGYDASTQTVFGTVAVCQVNSRPSGTHTQYVDFVMFSSNYKYSDAHTPVALWFKSTLHGHGMYFGDTSSYACLNGQTSEYNTRVEAWSQWEGYGPGFSSRWNSSGPYFTDTCGTALEDGWNIPLGIVTTQYNINVHASDGQWVQYSVNRWTGSSWVSHTAPVVKNVTYSSSWPTGPGEFDPSANGLFIGTTEPLGPGHGGSYTMGIRSLTVGWF